MYIYIYTATEVLLPYLYASLINVDDNNIEEVRHFILVLCVNTHEERSRSEKKVEKRSREDGNEHVTGK